MEIFIRSFLWTYKHTENNNTALILGFFFPPLSPSLFSQYFLPYDLTFKGGFPKSLPAVGFRLYFYAGLNPDNPMLWFTVLGMMPSGKTELIFWIL